MAKRISLYFVIFLLITGVAPAQVSSPSQQQTEASKTQAQLEAEVSKLTREQKQLCRQILNILDKAESVLQDSRDGRKFSKAVAEAAPLMKKLDETLPDGVFKNLMFLDFRMYSDLGSLFVLGQAVEENGEAALDERAKKFLADASERYSQIIGKEQASDMLDKLTVAELYSLARKTRMQTQKYVSQ